MTIGAVSIIAIICGFIGAFTFGLGGNRMPWIFIPFLFIMFPKFFIRRRR